MSACLNATIKLVGITYRRTVIKLVHTKVLWTTAQYRFKRGLCCFFSLLLCPAGKGNALSLLPGIDFVRIESRNCPHLYGLSRVCGKIGTLPIYVHGANWKIASKGVANISIRGNAPQCMTIAICFWCIRFLFSSVFSKIKL